MATTDEEASFFLQDVVEDSSMEGLLSYSTQKDSWCTESMHCCGRRPAKWKVIAASTSTLAVLAAALLVLIFVAAPIIVNGVL